MWINPAIWPRASRWSRLSVPFFLRKTEKINKNLRYTVPQVFYFSPSHVFAVGQVRIGNNGWLLGPVGMLLSVPLTSVCKIWMETTVGGSKLAILLGPGRPKSRLPG